MKSQVCTVSDVVIFKFINFLVKTFSKSQIINNKSLFLVARVEKEALQILEHPNVIKLLSTFQTELNLYMVFKYYPKSTCIIIFTKVSTNISIVVNMKHDYHVLNSLIKERLNSYSPTFQCVLTD